MIHRYPLPLLLRNEYSSRIEISGGNFPVRLIFQEIRSATTNRSWDTLPVEVA